MIQILLITIAPIIIAAAILMVGGIQLSKKSIPVVTLHDKELNRLEKAYLYHLGHLSQLHSKEDRFALRSRSMDFYGIHTLSIHFESLVVIDNMLRSVIIGENAKCLRFIN